MPRIKKEKVKYEMDFENEEDKISKLKSLADNDENEWQISRNNRLYKETIHAYGGKNLRRYKCNIESTICLRMAHKKGLCRKHLNETNLSQSK